MNSSRGIRSIGSNFSTDKDCNAVGPESGYDSSKRSITYLVNDISLNISCGCDYGISL